MFKGKSLRVAQLSDGIVEICFDRAGDAINVLDANAVDELKLAITAIRKKEGARGVFITSAKDSFIVGADIHEFPRLFAGPRDELAAYNRRQGEVFTALGTLPVPTVAVVNGLALGGGFELALAADYRVVGESARAGLPEVGLGIIPGYGGTVRLPRVVGAHTAIEWIVSGEQQDAGKLGKSGAADAVAADSELGAVALAVLRDAVASGDWRDTRAVRQGIAKREFDDDAVTALKAGAASRARHYPAASAVIELIERTIGLSCADALAAENETFARIATTPAAQALVQVFMNEQALRKRARRLAAMAPRTEQAAVLGAGIMGGGIAYASSVRGTSVIMKDIAQPALDAGVAEARKLLGKQVESGRLGANAAAAVLEGIVPTLEFSGFDSVSVVIEAIVENLAAKKRVLAEVEERVTPDTVIASNTSSLSISELAGALKRPEHFVGMHFFNPVPLMPLVEVIKGPQSSARAVATVAGYAVAMGKLPVVVKDCAGFLVNRILAAQFVGFIMLVRDGADYEQIDRAMEAFGWPMGPAYLQDVIGMDTSCHVVDIITAAYGGRMAVGFPHALSLMVERKRFGQKNGVGFYRYETDAKGRPRRLPASDTRTLLASVQPRGAREFDDEEIVDRMMLPMIVEAALCLDEGVAESAADIDMSLVLGIGFPRHWGGALKYADLVGIRTIVDKCSSYAKLGGCYEPTARMRAMAECGERFHALNRIGEEQ